MVAELTFWPIVAAILACMVVASPLYGAAAIAACVAVLIRTRRGRK